MLARRNSQRASIRSHSMIARWTLGNDTRRTSRQGGKSGPGQACSPLLRALSIFQPDQKAIGQHHRQRVPVEALPDAPLMLIPTQFTFRFFVILLDPATPMLVLDQFDERRLTRKVTPIIMILARRVVTGAFADQPTDVPCTIPVHAPTAHGRELRFELNSVSMPPATGLPVPRAVRSDERFRPLRSDLGAPPQTDLKVFAHGGNAAFAPLFQSVQKAGIVTIITIGDHARIVPIRRVCGVHQVERNFRFGLKRELRRHMRFGTAGRIVRPLARQVEPRRHRPGQRAFSIVAIDRHLTIADLAGRPCLLARHADRGRAFFDEARVINDQDPIAFAGQCRHLLNTLPIERRFIPNQIGEQLLQVLLRRAGHDLRQSVAILLWMLGQQASQIAFEAGKTPLEREFETEGGEKFGQFRQRFTWCLRQSFELCHAAILLISAP